MTPERTVWRVRLVTACLLLTAVCFHQAPGLIVPDTKLDLTANPGGFLVRALSLWDDSSLGQLQNQAYGYLFPVGPFHWALVSLGLPAWAVQRLWWSLVLCVAFLGLWRLATTLGVGGAWSRYLAAILFAVSPRLLSEVAVTSIEVWPMAVAPWVLLPLVNPRPASPRRRVARSALAFGCIGGVNAVATGVVLVLPALWLLTRCGGRRAVGMFFSWLGYCIAAALWWLVPLLVLGRYSPPFLDWIEDARVTTATASAVNAVQGTSAWLTFLKVADGPSWPAGWLFVTQPVLIVATLLVAVTGLVGLTLRGMPERGFLAAGLAVGAFALTAGFAGAAAGPFVDQIHGLLDGSLAALRNTHKFELVLRIPIMLGVAHALSVVGRQAWVRRLPTPVTAVTVAFVVVGAAAPAIAGSLPRAGAYETIPEHWRAAAHWLDGQPAAGSVLVVPAASFADFTWGSTKDEPLQALMRRPLVVRDAVPLGSAGATRFLDEVERRLRAGSGTLELRRALSAAGIRYVIVRNDLRIGVAAAEPLAVHEALDESGIRRVASFGPPAGSPLETRNQTVNERTLLPYPSVEVFDTGSAAAPRFVPEDEVLAATGGAEDSILPESVQPDGAVSVLGSDRAALGAMGDTVRQGMTDGLRRREIAFGRPSNNTSDVLTASDPGRTGRRTIDYVADAGAPQTTLTWSSVKAVRASSSASDATATLRLAPGYGPAAALDGDPDTRWVSGRFLEAVGEWLEVDFTSPRDVTGTTVLLSDAPPIEGTPTSVVVETDHGALTQQVRSGAPWRLRTPSGATSRLRIRLAGVSGPTPSGFSIAELSIPGVVARAVLSVPSAPIRDQTAASAAAPDLIALRIQNVGQSGCHFAGERPLCAAAFVEAPEEASGLFRTMTTAGWADYRMEGAVLPTSGPQLAHLLDFPGHIAVTATSSQVPSMAARPGTVVDDDLGTGWVASTRDPQPSLTLSLPEQRRLTGLQFLVDTALAASRPARVTIDTGTGAPLTRTVDSTGRVDFPAVRTRRLIVTFTATAPVTNIDAQTGIRSVLPVGVSELRIEGADDLRSRIDPSQVVEAACGFGPDLTIDGKVYPTRVTGTVRQLLRGEGLAWTTCGTHQAMPIPFGAGAHTLAATASAEFRPATLLLRRIGAQSSTGPRSPVVVTDSVAVIAARAQPGLLVMPHNFNAGWQATDQSGRALASVRVNGWQQAWLLPAGSSARVEIRFTPQSWYAAGLLVGLISLIGVVLVAGARDRDAGRHAPLTAFSTGPWPASPLPAGAVILTAGALLNAGAVGGVAVVIAAAVLALSGSRPWVAASAMAMAGAVMAWLVAAAPWTHDGAALTSAVAQVAAWFLLSMVGLRGVGERPPSRLRP